MRSADTQVPLNFNSRPCGRGDTAVLQPTIGFCISIHAPAGGATWRVRRCRALNKFQFTPLREGRQPRRRRPIHFAIISIHAPAGGATNPRVILTATTAYFNSRPCGRGDNIGNAYVIANNNISIHAPAGGATYGAWALYFVSIISIHAPAGGATHSRRPRQTQRKISIHAPAGGATVSRSSMFCQNVFQFTPLREGRQNPLSQYCPCIYFNSRPCGRGDSDTSPMKAKDAYFNSRPCGRGDRLAGRHAHKLRQISIHAPAGGATPGHVRPARRVQPISIHAPAGGATHLVTLSGITEFISIHAPAGGATE